jgi:nitrogen fixation NifU-like protein
MDLKTDSIEPNNRPTPSLNTRFFRHVQLPHNLGRLKVADGSAKGVGTCGDSIEVFFCVQNHSISEIKYWPVGCVYTIACASAMSTLVHGRSLEDALKLTPEDIAEELGGLPEDHLHCASLAVNTLGEAIEQYYRKILGRKVKGNEANSDLT